jgi:cytochrome c2
MYHKYLILLFILGLMNNLIGQDPGDYFAKNCYSCHTIGGGRLTGPDLKNVQDRKDINWLENFIVNPQAVINSGDSYAAELIREARNVIMPTLPGITSVIAKSIIEFIIAESNKESSRFAGMTFVDRPFTEEDREIGRKLYLGTQRLENKGPSCMACHRVAGEGFLGGGILGPDLTEAFGRIGGKSALAAWLMNPASRTMLPIYSKRPISENEILPLVAFLKFKAESNTVVSDVQDFNLLIIGFIGLVFCLVIIDALWRNRMRNVRKKMLKGDL